MNKLPYFTLLLFLFLSACKTEEKLNTTRKLNSDWQFKNIKEDKWLSAVVPGSVHEDLLDHNLIPDPFIGQNEKEVQWVEKETWEYVSKINFSTEELSHDFIELKFEGIDTYSSIYLNDLLLGTTDNMFISYVFSIETKKLREQNELRVVLHSPVVEGGKIKSTLDYTIPVHSEQIIAEGQLATSNLTRKAHYHYGWDWGPRLVSSGIWKPIKVKAWSFAKIESVFPMLDTLSLEIASYNTIIEVFSDREQEVEIQLSLSEKMDKNFHKLGKKVSFNLNKGLNKLSLPFTEINPVFWYPHNYGEPFLYNLYVDLFADNKWIESHSQKLGIRDLKVIQKPDSIGTSFYVEVNGIPIFCKGANYIPPHFFNGRLDSADYTQVIENARDANMNMLRVWGGGVYEKDEFYELCDFRGILVWQDFMFACNMYRGDSAFLASVETEARQNVKRLRSHPSLALWVGNNEILRGWKNWGWQEGFNLTEKESAKIWKDYTTIFYSILDKVIKEEDPQKLYWPSSPSSSFDLEENNKSGDSHVWDVWFGQKKFNFYQQLDTRFVSEFGFQSFPEMSTLNKIIRDTLDLGINTSFMQNRQRCKMDWIKPSMNGNLLIKQYMDLYYKEAKNFEEFVYLSQLIQADAIKAGMEAYRMDKPHTMGALFWQINDCWPTVSWSSIDYFGNWKAAHYAAKRANSNLFIGAEMKDSLLQIKGSYDGLEFPKVQASVEWLNGQGKTIWKETLKEFRMSNAKNEVFFEIPKSKLNLKDGVILMTLKSQRDSVTNVYYPESYKTFSPKSEQITVKAEKINGGYKLYLSSPNIQRAVFVSADCTGKFSDNYFDLIPNRKHEILFLTNQEIEPKFFCKAFAWEN